MITRRSSGESARHTECLILVRSVALRRSKHTGRAEHLLLQKHNPRFSPDDPDDLDDQR